MYSVRSALHLAVLLVILPSITWVLVKKINIRAAVKDLVLSQAQIVLAATGMLIISFAEARWSLIFGVVIFALGSAFPLSLRSLVTSLVQPQHFATLYASISVMQAVGIIFAGPALAATTHWGLVLGSPWTGLPFLFTAALFTLTLICVSCVRLGKPASIED